MHNSQEARRAQVSVAENRVFKGVHRGSHHKKIPLYLNEEGELNDPDDVMEIWYNTDEIYRKRFEQDGFYTFEDVFPYYVKGRRSGEYDRVEQYVSSLYPTKDFLARFYEGMGDVYDLELQDFYFWEEIKEDIESHFAKRGIISNTYSLEKYQEVKKQDYTGLTDQEIETLIVNNVKTVQELASVKPNEQYSKASNPDAILLRDGETRWQNIVVAAREFLQETQKNDKAIQDFEKELQNDPNKKLELAETRAAEAEKKLAEAEARIKQMHSNENVDTKMQETKNIKQLNKKTSPTNNNVSGMDIKV